MAEFSGIRAATRRAGRLVAVALGLVLSAVPTSAPDAAAAKKEAAPPPPPEPAKKEPEKKVYPKLVPVEAAPRIPRMLSDAVTGLGLGGFDPVSYFVDREPRVGRSEYEVDWHGAAWRFANEGNMLAFKEAPEVYAPRFAGYCAFQIGRGFPAEGSPYHYVVSGERLYVFASAANRAAFLQDVRAGVAAAEAAFGELARDLP